MVKSFFKSVKAFAQKFCGFKNDSNETIFTVGGHRGSGNTDRPIDIKYQEEREFFEPAENTVPSILKAFNDGVSFVEIDVVYTQDHQIAVTHSDDLRNHVLYDFEKPYFASQRSLENLLSLKVGPKMDGKIPTLSQVLETVKTLQAYKNSDFCVNIELKDVKDTPSRIPDDMFFFYRGILESIEESEFDISKIVFSSFALRDLIELRRLSKDARLGMLFVSDFYDENEIYPDQNIPDARNMYFTPDNIREAWNKAGIEFVHPELSDDNQNSYGVCKELGLSINFWMTEDAVLNGKEQMLKNAINDTKAHGIKSVGFIVDEVDGTLDLIAKQML